MLSLASYEAHDTIEQIQNDIQLDPDELWPLPSNKSNRDINVLCAISVSFEVPGAVPFVASPVSSLCNTQLAQKMRVELTAYQKIA